MRSRGQNVETRYVVNRLMDLEVGDAVIQRWPAWLMKDALREIGSLMKFHIDYETMVVTCTHKRKAS